MQNLKILSLGLREREECGMMLNLWLKQYVEDGAIQWEKKKRWEMGIGLGERNKNLHFGPVILRHLKVIPVQMVMS